jgi:hypothetical protein
MLQQDEGGQTHDLGLALKQPQQQPRQPDSLVAERCARNLRHAARGISFVEDEVDHRGNGGEPLGPLDRARRLERNVGRGDAALRPGNALLHRGLADQERACDLGDRQARHNAQREGDLLGRRQVGVATDEKEAKDVIAIVRAVESLGEFSFGVTQVRDGLFVRQRFLLAAASHLVERDVAADHDEPGRRLAWRTVLRPVPQRPQTRLLERLLGQVEVAEIA